MNNRRFFHLLLSVLTLFAAMSCEKTYAPGDGGDTKKGYDGINEDNDDYTGSSTDTVFVLFKGSSVTSTDNAKASVSNTIVTINSGGTYCLSGTLSGGQVIVDSQQKEDVRLVIKGASITCASSSAIYVRDAQKVIIVTAAGTTNYLADGTSYIYDDVANLEPDACIFSKSDLTFYGTGVLNVKGNFKNGISGKDGIIIKSGTINVTSVNNGIRVKDYLLVYNGNITVTSGGDGLKSTNYTDRGAGFIWIKGGAFLLTSATDAVSAYSNLTIDFATITIKAGGGSGTTTPQGYDGTVSAKGFKAKSKIEINDGIISINSADDAISCDTTFIMNSGSLNVSTMDDAVHSPESLTINGGTINVTKAYEGFKGANINVNGGNTTLSVTDDAVSCTKGSATEYNDGSIFTVTGGTIILNPSGGDGLDSNGSATISGGTVVIQGPSSAPEVAIDVNGVFNINGGILIASGPNSGSMIEGADNSSGQYSVVIKNSSSYFANTSLIHIQDGSNTDLVTFKPVRNASYIVFSSPSLTGGATYSLYTGGTYSVTTNTGGYYSGGNYSGGTFKKSFTLSSKASTISF